jgi:hypothetical protein
MLKNKFIRTAYFVKPAPNEILFYRRHIRITKKGCAAARQIAYNQHFQPPPFYNILFFFILSDKLITCF